MHIFSKIYNNYPIHYNFLFVNHVSLTFSLCALKMLLALSQIIRPSLSSFLLVVLAMPAVLLVWPNKSYFRQEYALHVRIYYQSL